MRAQRSRQAVMATAVAGFLGVAVAGCTGNSPHPQASMATVPSGTATAIPSVAQPAASPAGGAPTVVARVPPDAGLTLGQNVTVELTPGRIHLFEREQGERIVA